MRTTLDIDPKLLDQIRDLTGESSASKAVSLVLKEVIRKQKLKELREILGRIELEDHSEEMAELERRKLRRQLEGFGD